MKIVLATGGSGGHIFPALKTAEYLRNEGHVVHFAGALSCAQARLKQEGFSFTILDVQGLHLKNLPRFIKLMLSAVSDSKKLLQNLKPDVAVGFGSYSSFPILWAAKKLRIPVMLHEQNVIPGKANRLSSLFVKKIAVSFEETRKTFPKHQAVWTGCPCHSRRPAMSKTQLLGLFQLQPNLKTILILGGSQGSHVLNEIFFESVSKLKGFQFIHMTGQTDEAVYRQKYAALGVSHYVCAFLSNIEQAYAVSDIVVARAGAATVSELAAFGLPSILVPYPYARSHQSANARVLEKAGAAVIIDQANLNSSTLSDAIHRLDAQGLTQENIRYKVKDFFVNDPAAALAKAISDCAL